VHGLCYVCGVTDACLTDGIIVRLAREVLQGLNVVRTLFRIMWQQWQESLRI